MHPRRLRALWRSSSLFLRSYLIRRGFCTTSCEAAPAQLSEPARERILQLADQFESPQTRSSQIFLNSLGRFREWAMENKEPPTSKHLEIFFSMCFRSGQSRDIDIAMEYADTHGIHFSDGQVNALIASVAGSGDYTKTLEVWRKMEAAGVELRLSALCKVLQVAANERDFPTMPRLSKQLLQYRAVLSSHDVVSDTLKAVFQACRGAEDSVAMETTFILIDIFRMTRQKLSREMASVISQWVQSCEQLSLQETIVNYSGECGGCGLTLGSGDITLDELQMLRQHMEAMLQETIQQSANIQSELRRMDVLNSMVRSNEFGAIIDGLNVAHVFQKRLPNRKQLLQVAGEAVDATGKPVLALMRRHCISWFSPTPDDGKSTAEVAKTYENHGIHCFFTKNHDEDDLYLLYATLFSKPSTLLMTNDLQGCNKQRFPVNCHETFQQWLRRRLACIVKVRGQARIKFPPTYDDTVQWSPPHSGTSWQNLHIPLGYRRRWLCITRKQQNNVTQQNNKECDES